MAQIKVLDTFNGFSCKCGKCRNTCCKYWNITISLNEYLRLVGLDVSQKLREKMDKALSILPHTTPISYATLNLDLNGYCLMLDAEGYCALQRECGEEVLPIVCREYPRSYKKSQTYELSLTDSCEKVIEDLYSRNDYLKFTYIDKDLIYPVEENYLNEYQAPIYDIMVNNNSLLAKLNEVGKLIGCKEPELNQQACLKLTKLVLSTLLKKSFYLLDDLIVVLKSNIFDEQFFTESLKNFIDNNPHFTMFYTNYFINHLFYYGYPYISQRIEVEDHFYGLLILYYANLVMILSTNKTSGEDMIDLITYLARVFEHSNYYYNVFVLKNIYQKGEKNE